MARIKLSDYPVWGLQGGSKAGDSVIGGKAASCGVGKG